MFDIKYHTYDDNIQPVSKNSNNIWDTFEENRRIFITNLRSISSYLNVDLGAKFFVWLMYT